MKFNRNVTLIGLALLACQPKKSVDQDAELLTLSSLSTVTLGNFVSPDSQPYSRMEWKIVGVEGTVFDTVIAAEGLAESRASLPYGIYQFLLSYFDSAGRIIFESCSEGQTTGGTRPVNEKSRLHTIDAATYAPTIQICSIAGATAGAVSGPKSSIPNPAAKFYVDGSSQAAADAATLKSAQDPNAALIDFIAQQGAGVWLGAWFSNVGEAVRSIVDKAEKQDAYPLFVAYMIPYKDCGLHSAGGLDASRYIPWITDIANAIGNRKAMLILEPDAVAGLNQIENGKACLSAELRAERIELLKKAVTTLKSKANIRVYIDVGHAAWLSVNDSVNLLNEVGIAEADGFALNVSNFQTTEANVRYGQSIRARLTDKNFVIDSSRNGIDPGASTEWCNPRNRALGHAPTFDTGTAGLDAFIWGKRPGESDGVCNGGPAAGQWWREMAIELAKNAKLGN